jgi:hypothetical protein
MPTGGCASGLKENVSDASDGVATLGGIREPVFFFFFFFLVVLFFGGEADVGASKYVPNKRGGCSL